jgi:hypothetical protein
VHATASSCLVQSQQERHDAIFTSKGKINHIIPSNFASHFAQSFECKPKQVSSPVRTHPAHERSRTEGNLPLSRTEQAMLRVRQARASQERLLAHSPIRGGAADDLGDDAEDTLDHEPRYAISPV